MASFSGFPLVLLDAYRIVVVVVLELAREVDGPALISALTQDRHSMSVDGQMYDVEDEQLSRFESKCNLRNLRNLIRPDLGFHRTSQEWGQSLIP